VDPKTTSPSSVKRLPVSGPVAGRAKKKSKTKKIQKTKKKKRPPKKHKNNQKNQ